VGADFTMDVPIGDEKETVEKDQSTLERTCKDADSSSGVL
jgi:hypothetical protein